MKLLIYGINYSPELTGVGKYTGEMAQWLAGRGHDVHVITAPPYYPLWKVSAGYTQRSFVTSKGENPTVYRCPLWIPRHPTATSRLIHLFSFTFSSAYALMKQASWKPDVVICIAPSFFCAPQTILFSKLTGAKSWMHFQDFEICAMFGSGLACDKGWVNHIAHKLQAIITRRFDIISTISDTMRVNAQKNNVSKKDIILFPNWVDTDYISPHTAGFKLRHQWNIEDGTKVILYSGNLGKKQGLDLIINAASKLQERKNLLFVFVGEGAHKSSLVKKVQETELDNIKFYPLQSYELLPDLLRMADIHLVIQKKGVADAVLPSKLTSILAAGGDAIITAECDTELGRLVRGNPGIATLIPPENVDALVDAINELTEDPAIKRDYNDAARDYAVKNLGKEAILSDFEGKIIALVGNK